MLCGTDNIIQNILKLSHIQTKCGKYMRIFHEILSVPHNIVMNMNSVML